MKLTFEEMKEIELNKKEYPKNSFQFARRELTTVQNQNHLAVITSRTMQQRLEALEGDYPKYRENYQLKELLIQANEVHKEIEKYVAYDLEKVNNLGVQ